MSSSAYGAGPREGRFKSSDPSARFDQGGLCEEGGRLGVTGHGETSSRRVRSSWTRREGASAVSPQATGGFQLSATKTTSGAQIGGGAFETMGPVPGRRRRFVQLRVFRCFSSRWGDDPETDGPTGQTTASPPMLAVDRRCVKHARRPWTFPRRGIGQGVGSHNGAHRCRIRPRSSRLTGCSNSPSMPAALPPSIPRVRHSRSTR